MEEVPLKPLTLYHTFHSLCFSCTSLFSLSLLFPLSSVEDVLYHEGKVDLWVSVDVGGGEGVKDVVLSGGGGWVGWVTLVCEYACVFTLVLN